METQNHHQEPESNSFFQRNKNLFKGFIISFLILMLLIPTFFISHLISERRERNEEVKREIANQWSKSQTLNGPILCIPYLQQEKGTDNKVSVVKRYSYYLPEELKVDGTILPEYRARSTIFKLVVYTSKLTLHGRFNGIGYRELGIPSESLLPQEAFVIFGLSDYTGIQEQLKLKWDEREQNYRAGVHRVDIMDKGMHVPLPLTLDELDKPHSFAMNVTLRGSESIEVIPIGKTTKVNLNSAWGTPSFIGKTLPTHTITETDFKASWNAFDLNREFPQQWRSDYRPNFNESSFGVSLLQPLDNYGKTNRTIKYAILVIMLTFVVYFFIEVMQKKNVHAVQYVLIGFALCIFYTLLLSISEYMGFIWSYLVSALATILLISLYTKSVFGSMRTAAIFSGFLTMLYSFIFILIQLQDGALLVGSIGLFIILAAIMYFSRKIEWNK